MSESKPNELLRDPNGRPATPSEIAAHTARSEENLKRCPCGVPVGTCKVIAHNIPPAGSIPSEPAPQDYTREQVEQFLEDGVVPIPASTQGKLVDALGRCLWLLKAPGVSKAKALQGYALAAVIDIGEKALLSVKSKSVAPQLADMSAEQFWWEWIPAHRRDWNIASARFEQTLEFAEAYAVRRLSLIPGDGEREDERMACARIMCGRCRDNQPLEHIGEGRDAGMWLHTSWVCSAGEIWNRGIASRPVCVHGSDPTSHEPCRSVPRCPKCGSADLYSRHVELAAKIISAPEILCRKCGYDCFPQSLADFRQFFLSPPSAVGEPPQWYKREEFVQTLRDLKYCEENCQELADWLMENIVLAFRKGYQVRHGKEYPIPAAPDPEALALRIARDIKRVYFGGHDDNLVIALTQCVIESLRGEPGK